MRKIIIVFLMLILTMSIFAKVTYNDLGNGKYSVTLTYKDDTANQIYLIGSFQSWTEPGIPMTKNAEGLWEITIPMEKPKILYKFFNPDLEGDKYIEDPEALEAVANPFGTKDGVLRRPKKGGAKTEPDEWYPVFSLYSRNYFYQNVFSNLTKNITDDQYAIDSTDDGKRMWRGEFGTTDGDIARVRYGKGYMFFNNTVKFHGNVLKHWTIDVEVNTQGRYDWDFSTYWDATSDTARERKLTEIVRDNGSKIVDMFMGALTATNFDQLVFGWKFADVDVFLGAKNCKNINSKDPMMLVNGSKVGDKDSGAHNVEVLIHPTKVKGLNINIGVSKSNPASRKYMAYLDASYNILKQNKYTVGAIYYMTSYSPQALDAFANSINTMSLWASLKPIKGLTILAQGAIQLPTRYWNSYYSGGAFHDVTADDVNDSATDRVASTGYDFFANSAAYLKVGYTHKIFNISYQLMTGGSQFAGDLAKKGSLFSEEGDTGNEWNVVGEQKNLDYALPYANMYNSTSVMGAQIRNDISFNIMPIPGKKDLLKISFFDTFVVSKLEGLTMKNEAAYSSTNTSGYQSERFQLDNVFDIGVQSKFKINSINLLVAASAKFSLTVYKSNVMDYTLSGTTITPITSFYFTFNKASFDFELDNISKIFKKIGVHYLLSMDYYPGYYPAVKADYDSTKFNKIQWRKLFNQVIVNMEFSNKIGVNAGFIARLYHGEGANDDSNRWVFSDDSTYSTVREYFNFGIALGFTYVIPLEILQTPLFYVNFSIGWDPFRDATFGEEYQTIQANAMEVGVGDANDKSLANNINQEESILTIGLKWDF